MNPEDTVSEHRFGEALRQLGALRLMLLLIALVVTAFSVDVPANYYDGLWNLIHGAVIPALVPMLFMVLMMDALIARVWQSGASETEHRRLGRAIAADLLVAFILVAAWGRFFYGLLG